MERVCRPIDSLERAMLFILSLLPFDALLLFDGPRVLHPEMQVTRLWPLTYANVHQRDLKHVHIHELAHGHSLRRDTRRHGHHVIHELRNPND